MSYSARTALLGPEFDAFLFASVDSEGDGRFLSVVSALARLGLDPWNEAVDLAAMPRAAAGARLAGLIATLPNAPGARRAAAEIAARLVALLPRISRVSDGDNLSIGSLPPLNRQSAIRYGLAALFVLAGLLFLSRAMETPHDAAGPAPLQQAAPTGIDKPFHP